MASCREASHILVIPFQAPGHMLPLLDLLHQLAIRALEITIMVTPKNLPILQPLLKAHTSSIHTLVLPFPPHPAIPAGVENMQELPIHFLPDIISANCEFYNPVLQWFQAHPSPPVAILSDMFHSPWTLSLARHLGIQRIGFSPLNSRQLSSEWCNEGFANGSNLPESFKENIVANVKSWGFIVNTFTELESENLDRLRKENFGHERVWAVGPLLPLKGGPMAINDRGGASSIPASDILAWLDSCRVDKSVVYIGFGSLIALSKQQIEEVATALEKSGVRFIWSVKSHDNVLPTGFEDRTSERGLVIRGWAPQVAILGHRAVGGYLTHCGWNSALEGILNEVLLLAWPMQADHFFNAKLLVDELGAAIQVCEGVDSIPDSAKLTRVLAESVGGYQSERRQTMELRQKVLNAIGEGGSSQKALDEFVNELSTLNSK